MAQNGEEILDSLYNRAIEEGLITARYEQGRIGLLFSVIAAELEYWEEILDYYLLQSNLITASDEVLIERLCAPFAVRRPATVSFVKLTFARKPDVTEAITIPINTIVETAEENPKQYYTLEDGLIAEADNEIEIMAQSFEQGSISRVGPLSLVVVVDSDGLVDVTNEAASYGGLDIEPITQTRDRALNLRYSMEKGTLYNIMENIRSLGISDWDFNIKEHAFGYGTFAVYVDTTSDELIRDVGDVLRNNVAYGIYFDCAKATQIPFDFSFTVNVAQIGYLQPKEFQQLKLDIETYLRLYIDGNGIGNNLILSKAIHYLYQQLLDSYDISDIDLVAEGDITILDEKGNIVLEPHQVIQVFSVDVQLTNG